MTTDRTFDAVLCDLDGVLRQWPPMTVLEQLYRIPPGTLAATAFAPDRLLPAITGVHTDEEWRAGIEVALRAYTPDAAGLVADWSAGAGVLDEEVLAVLRLARWHGPVVVVTNATTRLARDVAALGLAGHVDAIVNSAELGFAKPDPRIYHAAAEVAGVPPSRCLFVDDSAGNVAAARKLGMTGLLFRDVAGLRDVVSRRHSAPRAAPRPGPAGTPPRGRRS